MSRTHENDLVSSCTETRHAVEQGIFIATLIDPTERGTPRKRIVTGVAPDGARRVRVHTLGAPTVAAPVRDNVFTLRDERADPPEAITPGR